MRRYLSILLMIGLCCLCGCTESGYSKYRSYFIDTFDTMVQIVGYAETDEDFNAYTDLIHQEMLRYHQYFDKYNNYPGINNIKTINDQAGIAPVEVDPVILELISLSMEWYEKTDGAVNIAFGPVLSVWHDYRERYQDDPQGAKLPSQEELEAAAQLTDINQVIIDWENQTVFLAQPGMSLDVGAVAKGFATEKAGDYAYSQGFTSFMISSGGNVRIYDSPANPDKVSWGVGLQDPQAAVLSGEDRYLDTLFLNDCSVVTSGNYQRYYMVDGQRIHHIIDPETLMPAQNYTAVTVVTKDSGLADLLSTALYIMDQEEGEALARANDAMAIWIDEENNLTIMPELIPYMQQQGGASSQKS